MKTQYYTAASLDGFIATEDDSLDWLFPLGDLDSSSYPEFIADVGALAMGSSTYEWMLRHAEQVKAETGSPWPYCSGQLIPDTVLSFSSATAGANPSLNRCGRSQLYRCIK